jgi:segregation and condensation protein A
MNALEQQFTVDVEGFRGPLELLLDLIEKRELYVNDISLAQVADDYIHYIEDQENVPVGETAHFVYVASTLLLIKSRSLLPNLTLTEEEEEDIHDLEKRLSQYRLIREAARHIRARWETNYLYAPKHVPIMEPIFTPASDVELGAIRKALTLLVESISTNVVKPTARIRKEIHLADMIDRLADRIQAGLTDTFSSMTKGNERMEAIVSFLALLELVKRGTISVTQSNNFEEIEVKNDTLHTPRYG